MEDSSDQLSEADEQGGLVKEAKQFMQGYIAIKGTRNGLLLTLEPETPFSDLLNALAERLAEAPSFFRGASLTLDTSRRSLRLSERTQLETLLAHYQMSVVPLEQIMTALPSKSSEASAAPSLVSQRVPTAPLPLEELGQMQRDQRESADTLFVRRTIRSGQAIHHPSNVVIMGDINQGAEVVAGGDVVVWGVLRGMVHAGYPDNENAVVCSLLLAPLQLRIARLLSRPPDGFEVQPRPEVATIRQGQIVVEAWVNGRPPRK